MKAIKKLKIIWRMAILLAIIPFFYFTYKNNNLELFLIIILAVLFILSRKIFFKNKNISSKEYYEDYTNVSLYYFYGGIFLVLALLFSLGSMIDLINKNPVPLFGIVTVSFLWISGILITYYTYQTKKESQSIKEKPKKKIEMKKVREFNINYIMAFLILATIISFVFKLIPFTPMYVSINILVLIILYLLMRIVHLKIK